MKKTLLSALAGLAVIGSAYAIPTPDIAQENCKQLETKGTHVWDAHAHTCCIKNPCTDGPTLGCTSCYEEFKDVQVESERQAFALAKRLIKNFELRDSNCKVLETTLVKQDYISCTTDDGGYRVFEFNDISDISNQTDVVVGVITGTCIANNGAPNKLDERTYFNLFEIFRSKGDDNSFLTISKHRNWQCSNSDEQKCKEMANFATALLGKPSINANYTEEMGCILTPDNF